MIKFLQFLVGLVASLLDKAFQMDQAYSGRHQAKVRIDCDVDQRAVRGAGVPSERGDV
jgi:hypothetical protein